jgi:hypothetical protein
MDERGGRLRVVELGGADPRDFDSIHRSSVTKPGRGGIGEKLLHRTPLPAATEVNAWVDSGLDLLTEA